MSELVSQGMMSAVKDIALELGNRIKRIRDGHEVSRYRHTGVCVKQSTDAGKP